MTAAWPSSCRARSGYWTARWFPTSEPRHERHGRTVVAAGRAAGGERWAARPAAARRAVGARDRDRHGGDRGGPRAVVLLAGRASCGDRPARHEHAHGRGWAEPHWAGREAAPRSARADHASGQRSIVGTH